MIPEPSRQDTTLTPPPAQRFKRRALTIGAAAALVAVSATLYAAWSNSEHSVTASRLRIAEVTRGTLVRDAAVNGRVVAAVSPTLYSTAPATVTLKVAAGDTVKKGDVLAVLESPDLSDALKREAIERTSSSKAEVARQQILSRKQKLLAQREADTAEIDRLSAQRTLERYESVAQVGIIAKIDYQKAKDALNSADIRASHATQAAAPGRRRRGPGAQDQDQRTGTPAPVDGQRPAPRRRTDRARAGRRLHRHPVGGRTAAWCAANTPLMTLVDLSRLEVELEVPETYVADMGLGMRAEIDTGAIGTATGKLSALSPEVVKNQVLARVRFDGEQPTGLRQSQRVSGAPADR